MLQNLDFEQTATAEAVPGWLGGGDGMDRLVTTERPHGGARCGCIRSRPGLQGGFAALTQGIAADRFRGQRVELSGWLRTADVLGTGALWLRVDGPDGALCWDNMMNRPVQGTTDWQQATVVLDVAPTAVRIYLGAMLQGRGTVWVDDLALRTVGREVMATGGPTGPSAGPGLFELRGGYAVTAVDGTPPRQGPHLLLPVPLSYGAQVPVAYRLTVEPPDAGTSLRVLEDQPGNFVAEVRLRPPAADAPIQLRWRAIVLCAPRRFEDLPATAPLPAEWPAEARPWLRATRFVQADDPRIQAIAQRVRGDRHDALAIVDATLREARAIKDAQRGPAADLGAVAALTGQGSCTSAANLLAALLRSAGIPARILSGYPTWSGPLRSHYLVEAMIPGYGWYPIESTLLRPAWPPYGQIQVAVVPPEYEDRGGERFPNAAGVPWLSLTEHPDHDGSYFAAGTIDERHMDHVATWWRRFAEDAPASDWQAALGRGRDRWAAWVSSRPEARGAGCLATAVTAEDLASTHTPAQVAACLGTLPATRKNG